MPVKRIKKDGSSDGTKFKCDKCSYWAKSKGAITRHKNKGDHVASTGKKQLERDPKTGRITKGVAQETNKNGTAGRPTKYDPSLCEKMIKFFSVEKKKRELIKESIVKGKYGENISREWKYFANDTPFFQKFAREVKIDYSTLFDWAHAKVKDRVGKRTDELLHPDFADAYNICKQLQYEFLVDNGLQGLYPPASFIFVAKNITDLKDTNTNEITLRKKTDEEVDDDELATEIFG